MPGIDFQKPALFIGFHGTGPHRPHGGQSLLGTAPQGDEAAGGHGSRSPEAGPAVEKYTLPPAQPLQERLHDDIHGGRLRGDGSIGNRATMQLQPLPPRPRLQIAQAQALQFPVRHEAHEVDEAVVPRKARQVLIRIPADPARSGSEAQPARKAKNGCVEPIHGKGLESMAHQNDPLRLPPPKRLPRTPRTS